uniref:Uncharacterized protein n=1 Tax=Panagrellus redivivus TaxID=6233 RepID=A0A7E4UU05_PANRE
MSSTSVVSLMIFAFLALFAVVSAQNYGVRDPFAYQNSVGYGYRQFPYVDPYNDAALNGGTPSSWYDQILIHAVPRG